MSCVASLLSGPSAFYHQENIQNENFTQPLKQAHYTTSIEKRIYVLAKTLFKYTIALPITLTHHLIGLAILPGSILTYFANFTSNYIQTQRIERAKLFGYQIKRIRVDIDGYQVDAQIIGKKEHLNNGRWTLFAGGNAMLCNEIPAEALPLEFLNQTQSNLITFNYPSVGQSSHLLPSKQGCVKAIQGLLKMLEDKEQGLGAQKIAIWGLSIGGGFVGEALAQHKKQDDISYAVIKDRTFSDISSTATHVVINSENPSFLMKTLQKIIYYTIYFFGWEISSHASLNTFKAPEIILQQATGKAFEGATSSTIPIENIEDIKKTDGIIQRDDSLAAKILSQGVEKPEASLIIGIKENHFSPLCSSIKDLAEKVNSLF